MNSKPRLQNSPKSSMLVFASSKRSIILILSRPFPFQVHSRPLKPLQATLVRLRPSQRNEYETGQTHPVQPTAKSRLLRPRLLRRTSREPRRVDQEPRRTPPGDAETQEHGR